MAQVGQLYYKIQGPNGLITSPEISAALTGNISRLYQLDICNDVIGPIVITKLSVTAPPGTRFILNAIHEITVGRSGVYQIDAQDIAIKRFQFEEINQYEIDTSNSKTNIIDGLTDLADAGEGNPSIQTVLGQATGLINSNYEANDWNDIVSTETALGEGQSLSNFTIIQQLNDKLTAIQTACRNYLAGINGVYKKAEGTVTDHENIIIDYVYETNQSNN